MLSKISIKVEILFDGDRCVSECPFLVDTCGVYKFCRCFGHTKLLNTVSRKGYYYAPVRSIECLDYEKQNANLRSTEVIENEKNTSSS